MARLEKPLFIFTDTDECIRLGVPSKEDFYTSDVVYFCTESDPWRFDIFAGSCLLSDPIENPMVEHLLKSVPGLIVNHAEGEVFSPHLIVPTVADMLLLKMIYG